MCVVSKVEELTTECSDSVALWLDALNPLVIKLKRCIEVMCSRATVGLTFFALQVTSLTLLKSYDVMGVMLVGTSLVLRFGLSFL